MIVALPGGGTYRMAHRRINASVDGLEGLAKKILKVAYVRISEG